MKSNTEHTSTRHVPDPDKLRLSIQREKELLVTMFLSNASQMELNEQFKRIDELCVRMSGSTGLRD